MPRRPLSSRPLDFLYVSFFLIHIPTSLLTDFQTLYGSYTPTILRNLMKAYLDLSADPIITGMLIGDPSVTRWMTGFFCMEALLQLPIWIFGAWALYQDTPLIYVPLMLYGASTATTTLPCITWVVTDKNLTSEQLLILLSGYVPFFLIPLLIALDMGWRVHGIVSAKHALKKD